MTLKQVREHFQQQLFISIEAPQVGLAAIGCVK
jgi:hypothetical protein